MPIKAENRALYAPDWSTVIRPRILERAGHRCEHPGCNARQYAVGIWAMLRPGGVWDWVWTELDQCDSYSEGRQRAAEIYWDRAGYDERKPIVIVLTIAHLDHDPTNNDDDNLRALCQRHHLAHDAAHHAATAHATRQARRAVGDLFQGIT